jgi:hypothetical protein
MLSCVRWTHIYERLQNMSHYITLRANTDDDIVDNLQNYGEGDSFSQLKILFLIMPA